MKKIVALFLCILVCGCAKINDGLGAVSSRTSDYLSMIVFDSCLQNNSNNICAKVKSCTWDSLMKSYEQRYIISSGADVREYLVRILKRKSYSNLDKLNQTLIQIDPAMRDEPRYKFSTRDMKFELSNLRKTINQCRPS